MMRERMHEVRYLESCELGLAHGGERSRRALGEPVVVRAVKDVLSRDGGESQLALGCAPAL